MLLTLIEVSAQSQSAAATEQTNTHVTVDAIVQSPASMLALEWLLEVLTTVLKHCKMTVSILLLQPFPAFINDPGISG